MSFKGGGIGGDAGPDRGGNRGGGGNRKHTKKFGKNLNKLTKAPAAPPVPIVSSASGGGSSGSFRGLSSNRNGLLLLSTKSKSSSGVGIGGGGLLAAAGTPKTAHDELLLSAGARDGDSNKKLSVHAWGAGGAKESEEGSLVDDRGSDTLANVGGGSSNFELTPYRENTSLQRQTPSSDRWTEKISSLENRSTEKSVYHEQSDTFGVEQRPSGLWTLGDVTGHVTNLSLSKSHNGKDLHRDRPSGGRTSSRDIPQASNSADACKTKTNEKDYQAEYMSKLAKERAEKLRLEEEARAAAQKERAAIRLRVLEEKRLEERKRLLSIQSQERKELSKPSSQVILESLGKPKKDNHAPYPARLTTNTRQKGYTDDGQTLFDPDRSFSSLATGKTLKSNSINNAELFQGSAKPVVYGPASSSISVDNENYDTPKPVHMVQLSNLDELDRGGRGEGQRMLFDPNSGSLVAVPSREGPKSTKKTKQKAPPKAPVKMSNVIIVESSDSKLMRGKQGKSSSRKEDHMLFQQRNKKPLDKGKQIARKRVPRTRGVLYKIDKSGNYLNVDESEPDEGFGAHLVPGGKIKNPGAHELLMRQRELKKSSSQPNFSASTTEGFSFRNDPGFLQHQTNFEAQQQKILEDAWASLVENDEPVETSDVEKKELSSAKSGDDEYVAALEFSPSIIGLNFDVIDTMDSIMLPPSIKASGKHVQEEAIVSTTKFALYSTSRVDTAQSTNPFISPLGGVPGASLWGASSNPGATSAAYDLSALTGWTPAPFGETDPSTLIGTVDLHGSSSQSSKLHLWGSSALDDN